MTDPLRVGTAKGPGEKPHEFLFITPDPDGVARTGEFVFYALPDGRLHAFAGLHPLKDLALDLRRHERPGGRPVVPAGGGAAGGGDGGHPLLRGLRRRLRVHAGCRGSCTSVQASASFCFIPPDN